MSQDDTVLCLRTCKADMTSYRGFQWPREGEISAPDWDPTPGCGGGLHGLLWGEGEAAHLNWAKDAIWIVFEAAAQSVVDIGGKVKVPSATVVRVGERMAVAAWLSERAPGRAVVSGTTTAGYGGTAIAGYRGTATAGYGGTAIAGYSGTATAGDGGTAIAGDGGTATAGDWGTATAGDWGTATAGVDGVIAIRGWKGKRYRWTLGEIGETNDANGTALAPDTPYRLDSDGQFVLAAVTA